MNEESEEGECRWNHAHPTDLISQDWQFLLQWSVIRVLLEFLFINTFPWVSSDRQSYHVASPFHDLGARNQEWVAFSLADFEVFLFNLVTFACDWALIGWHFGCFKYNTVNTHNFTSLNLHNIAHQQVIDAHVNSLSVSYHVHIFPVCHFIELPKLLLFHVVVAGGHPRDDHHSQDDGGSFKPSFLDTMHEDAQC